MLDEPTNHLDLNAVLWLEDHLAKRFKGTLLCVSHDADFLDNIATDVIELEGQALHTHGGDVYKFLNGRQGREKRRAADHTLQDKTIKQGLQKGILDLGLIQRTTPTVSPTAPPTVPPTPQYGWGAFLTWA